MSLHLNSISTDQVYKWKISFNTDNAEATQEFTFSRKTKNITYLPIVKRTSQKHLGLNLRI